MAFLKRSIRLAAAVRGSTDGVVGLRRHPLNRGVWWLAVVTTALVTACSGGSSGNPAAQGSSGAGGGGAGGADAGGACGTCGPNGSCVGGKCVCAGSQTVCDGTCTAGGCLSQLVAGQQPTAMTSDGTNLYWLNDVADTLYKVPVAGGTPVVLASQLQGAYYQTLAVAQGSVYWASDTVVRRVPISGGTPIAVYDAAGTGALSGAVAADATNVYWTLFTNDNADLQSGAIMKLGYGDTTPTTLASGFQEPMVIGVDATNVYFNEQWNSMLMKVSIQGGYAFAAASYPGEVPLAVDDDGVCWVNPATGSVVALTGSGTIKLASGQKDPESIAVNGGNAYWVNAGSGTVMTAPLTGGKAPVTLASGQNIGQTVLIAADAANVYWETQDGISKLALK